MAEVSNGQQDVAGIKLFGTTITLQNSKQVQSDDHHRRQAKKADGDVHDQTVEMKRPEKIIPCPRCKSTETKFCYFNNYNVNQPRHFCKGCQRYWTDGGALRNVPVGAGRRKTKPPGRDQVMTSSFPEGCMYEASEVMHQFELDGMVEQWHVAAVQGDYRHVFPVVKRRRSGSGGQTCS